jgi:hypothetical protein
MRSDMMAPSEWFVRHRIGAAVQNSPVSPARLLRVPMIGSRMM